jgi:hypothetical protein
MRLGDRIRRGMTALIARGDKAAGNSSPRPRPIPRDDMQLIAFDSRVGAAQLPPLGGVGCGKVPQPQSTGRYVATPGRSDSRIRILTQRPELFMIERYPRRRWSDRVGIFWTAVNPLRCAVRASRKPWGLREKTSCFSRSGKYPPDPAFCAFSCIS